LPKLFRFEQDKTYDIGDEEEFAVLEEDQRDQFFTHYKSNMENPNLENVEALLVTSPQIHIHFTLETTPSKNNLTARSLPKKEIWRALTTRV